MVLISSGTCSVRESPELGHGLRKQAWQTELEGWLNFQKLRESLVSEYDGIERNYKQSDPDSYKNHERVENILGFLPKLDGLKFYLSFYSGGIGVFDKLAISCEINSEQTISIRKKFTLYSPEDALSVDHWAEDFVWLVKANGEEGRINQCSAEFINGNKRDFQELCTPVSDMYFSYQSDVNNWTAIWGSEVTLNFLYFDQG